MTQDYQTIRPWRNNNPGDLRVLQIPEQWFGQTGIDDGPGGPFAIFDSQSSGWRALAMNLLAYQDIHHLKTVTAILTRYAPSLENDTSGYIATVCEKMGITPYTAINVHNLDTMLSLVSAIALVEGGPHLPWPEAEKQAGVCRALNLPFNRTG